MTRWVSDSSAGNPYQSLQHGTVAAGEAGEGRAERGGGGAGMYWCRTVATTPMLMQGIALVATVPT